MRIKVQLHKSDATLPIAFSEVVNVSDGGYERGYSEGKQAAYDDFWDAYQTRGDRYDYTYAFAGAAWGANTIKPKYDIVPKYGGAGSIFRGSAFVGSLKEHFDTIGIKLDFSNLTTCGTAFYEAGKITETPDLDLSGCTSSVVSVFYNCTSLKTAKLILSEKSPFADNFVNCSALENLTIGGTIGQKGFNVQWSKLLSKVSITSIITMVITAAASWFSVSDETNIPIAINARPIKIIPTRQVIISPVIGPT